MARIAGGNSPNDGPIRRSKSAGCSELNAGSEAGIHVIAAEVALQRLEPRLACAMAGRNAADAPRRSQGMGEALDLLLRANDPMKPAENPLHGNRVRVRSREDALDARMRAACDQHLSLRSAQAQGQLRHLHRSPHLGDRVQHVHARRDLGGLREMVKIRMGPWRPVADQLRPGTVVIWPLEGKRPAPWI